MTASLLRGFLLSCIVTGGVGHAAVVDSFDHGPGEWRSYDFNGMPFGDEGGNGGIYYPVTWQPSGGVGDSGYVWSDDSRWRIDTPETPDSILAFIIYREWMGASALDLRNAVMSVNLRGDDFDLKGATINFWVLNNTLGVRYHYTGAPLNFTSGAWGSSQNVKLLNDSSMWTLSWQRYADTVTNLDTVLGGVDSYGFSFLHFPHGVEVTGRFAMDQLVLSSVPEPSGFLMLALGAGFLGGWSHLQNGRRAQGVSGSSSG